MSKGLSNSYNFNISCKKCGSTNITAEEIDGYIYLQCIDCVKLEKINEVKHQNNAFIKEFILNENKSILKKQLEQIVQESEKSLINLKKISKILEKDFKENEKTLKDLVGLVFDNSSYKDEVFNLIEEIKNFNIITHIYKATNYYTINIDVVDKLIKNKKFEFYEVGIFEYNFELKINNYSSSIVLENCDEYNSDTILMNDEVDGFIHVSEKYIVMLKEIIKKV